jgi:hypothetical protein
MAITGYTVESMAYLTSGMVDKGEDCSLEAAMCKVCKTRLSVLEIGSTKLCIRVFCGIFTYFRAI